MDCNSLFPCKLDLLATLKILLIENFLSDLPSLLLISDIVSFIALYVKKLESRLLASLSSRPYLSTFIGPFLGIMIFWVWFNEIPPPTPRAEGGLEEVSRTLIPLFLTTWIPDERVPVPTKGRTPKFWEPRREKLFFRLTTGAAATLTIWSLLRRLSYTPKLVTMKDYYLQFLREILEFLAGGRSLDLDPWLIDELSLHLVDICLEAVALIRHDFFDLGNNSALLFAKFKDVGKFERLHDPLFSDLSATFTTNWAVKSVSHARFGHFSGTTWAGRLRESGGWPIPAIPYIFI